MEVLVNRKIVSIVLIGSLIVGQSAVFARGANQSWLPVLAKPAATKQSIDPNLSPKEQQEQRKKVLQGILAKEFQEGMSEQQIIVKIRELQFKRLITHQEAATVIEALGLQFADIDMQLEAGAIDKNSYRAVGRQLVYKLFDQKAIDGHTARQLLKKYETWLEYFGGWNGITSKILTVGSIGLLAESLYKNICTGQGGISLRDGIVGGLTLLSTAQTLGNGGNLIHSVGFGGRMPQRKRALKPLTPQEILQAKMHAIYQDEDNLAERFHLLNKERQGLALSLQQYQAPKFQTPAF